MVLRILFMLTMSVFIFGCSAIGYMKYEEKAEATQPMELSQQKSKENKYIVREYYLVPDEWWLEYPHWQWSFGFYLWEPYWWYPYYSIRCPGCYLYDPYVFKFKEYRKFEKRNIESGTPSEGENPSDKTFNEPSTRGLENKTGEHRRFKR